MPGGGSWKNMWQASKEVLSSLKSLYSTAKAAKNVVGLMKSFKMGEDIIHFGKHGPSIKNALNKSAYTISDYVRDANHVVKHGTYVKELNGYVKLIGGQGSAKYGFVGLDQATGRITTFHVKQHQSYPNQRQV